MICMPNLMVLACFFTSFLGAMEQIPQSSYQSALSGASSLPPELQGHIALCLAQSQTLEQAVQSFRALQCVCHTFHAALNNEFIRNQFIKRASQQHHTYKTVVAYKMKTVMSNRWLDAFVEKTQQRMQYVQSHLEEVSSAFYGTLGLQPRIHELSMVVTDYWQIAGKQLVQAGGVHMVGNHFFQRLRPESLIAVCYLAHNAKPVMGRLLHELSQKEVKLSPSTVAATSFLRCLELVCEAELLHLKFQNCHRSDTCKEIMDARTLRAAEQKAYALLGLPRPGQRTSATPSLSM